MCDEKTLGARLEITMLVYCPYCDYRVDILTPECTSGYDHNDGGCLIDEALADDVRAENHKVFSVRGIKCSNCGKEFNVKGLEWRGEELWRSRIYRLD